MITSHRQEILALSPLTVGCVCEYDRWYKQFRENQPTINRHIDVINEHLGEQFTRQDIISFHRCDNIDNITKFISVMMWGYSSDGENRPDYRGPSRVQKMTADLDNLSERLSQARELIQNKQLREAYMSLYKKIPMCGPNFFSKYFYFVGRSLGIQRYPLIFDNRVANGLVKISVSDRCLLNLVSVQTISRADTYVNYVNLIHDWTESFQCEADQIELFLFRYSTEQVA